jgi:hypothetical protein
MQLVLCQATTLQVTNQTLHDFWLAEACLHKKLVRMKLRTFAINLRAFLMQRLHTNMQRVLSAVVQSAKTNPDVAIGIQGSITPTGIKIKNISITKHDGHFIITRKNTVLYSLAWYKSALGITKHLLYTKNASRIADILQFDSRLEGAQAEIDYYNTRRFTLSEPRCAIAEAKYGQTVSKIFTLRQKISSLCDVG